MYSSEQITEMIKTGMGTPEYRRAMAHIYEKHKSDFFNRLTRGKYRLAPDAALDIYHQSIVILVQKIQQDEIKNLNISAFLWGICHHLFLQKQDKDIRKQKNQRKYSANINPTTVLNPAEGQLLDEAYRHLVDQVFGQLGEKCRQILLARQMNYSYREIAVQLNPETPSSDSVIRVTAGRCVKKLTQLVEQNPNLKKQIDDLLM